MYYYRMSNGGYIKSICQMMGDCEEITETEYNANVEPVPDPESPESDIPAWDIRSNTAFHVGDLVTSEGVTYECIEAHNASWSRQPPNTTYWREV